MLLASLLFFSLSGCGTSDEMSVDKDTHIDISWQWQLNGPLNTSYDVDVYDIDLFDTDIDIIDSLHQRGIKVICYFSAGSYESWREDAQEFPQDALGNKLDAWQGERWLDIRNDTVKNIMINRLDLAKEKGCDGVEPDNIDGYTYDTGFDLTANDQLQYNKFLSAQAKQRGLLIALKNDMKQIKELEPYFDLAINEQCHQYNECKLFLPFIEHNKPVFNAEYAQKYKDNTNGARDQLCIESKALGIQTLILPIKLDDTFRYSCNE